MSRTIKSTTGLSRQFLNLVVAHHVPGIKSLRFLNLKREQLFNPTPLPPTAPTDVDRFESTTPQDATSQTPPTESFMMERIRLPGPSFQFQSCNSQGLGWNISCFPLSDRRVVCMDQSGLNFLFDGVTRHIVTMPILHIPKTRPISLFIPSTDVIGGGSLFLVDRIPRQCSNTVEFESLVYRKTGFCNTNSWHGQLLPSPPYAHDPSYWSHRSEISSYTVVGGGSHICISVKDVGTYCLDTVSHTWSQVGKWTLPFSGKVEYIPELKLWFGLSANGQQVAAADLSSLSNAARDSSAMEIQPELLGSWMELTLPEGWKERKKAQLVNLGSGRFCISRFFRITTISDSSEFLDYEFSVLTGVEMVPLVDNDTGNAISSGSGDGSKGKIKLKMIPHKSRFHSPVNEITIEEVF
ncbi:hypothetical protein QOZ80_7BG0608620 [Eleusine coracana subsp. coracana]|nr:hypothetical protein QOZ80_7BG0608620 [Eleusine coracana subsp. coracana]